MWDSMHLVFIWVFVVGTYFVYIPTVIFVLFSYLIMEAMRMERMQLHMVRHLQTLYVDLIFSNGAL